ncbi:MAG: hypothetical protein ACD_75C02275G0001, partial [uncultured bacterium]
LLPHHATIFYQVFAHQDALCCSPLNLQNFCRLSTRFISVAAQKLFNMPFSHLPLLYNCDPLSLEREF